MDSEKSQTVENEELTDVSPSVLPPGLPLIFAEHPNLAKLGERWQDLPSYTKEAILALAGISK